MMSSFVLLKPNPRGRQKHHWVTLYELPAVTFCSQAEDAGGHPGGARGGCLKWASPRGQEHTHPAVWLAPGVGEGMINPSDINVQQ